MTRRPARPLPALLATGLALLLTVWAAGPAAAHSAALAYQGSAGPYTVWAYQGTPGDAPATIAYTAALRVSATGTPVDDATVTVTAATPDSSDIVGRHAGPVTATPIANLYQYVLPDPGPDLWTVRLRVSAPAGTGTATFTVNGLQNRAPTRFQVSPWVIASIGVLGFAGLAAAAWFARGRRTRTARSRGGRRLGRGLPRAVP